MLYAASIDTQREWARELLHAWSERPNEQYPDLIAHVEPNDTGDEVVVTFWCEPRNE